MNVQQQQQSLGSLPPPELVKLAGDVPYIEDFGPISWAALPERVRGHLRIACVLISSRQTHVQQAEYDKTMIMNMMAQGRVRSLPLAGGGATISSCTAPPPAPERYVRPAPPPPPGQTGQHQ